MMAINGIIIFFCFCLFFQKKKYKHKHLPQTQLVQHNTSITHMFPHMPSENTFWNDGEPRRASREWVVALVVDLDEGGAGLGPRKVPVRIKDRECDNLLSGHM
jgi:hypothetical protein